MSLDRDRREEGVEGVKGIFCAIQFCYCYISLQCIFMAIDLLSKGLCKDR